MVSKYVKEAPVIFRPHVPWGQMSLIPIIFICLQSARVLDQNNNASQPLKIINMYKTLWNVVHSVYKICHSVCQIPVKFDTCMCFFEEIIGPSCSFLKSILGLFCKSIKVSTYLMSIFMTRDSRRIPNIKIKTKERAVRRIKLIWRVCTAVEYL